MLESEIKRRCKDLLEKSQWMVIHLIQTNCNGIPDTLIIHEAKGIIFIEFKRPGEKPEALQNYRMQKLNQKGIKTRVVKSVDDIKDLL
jgi:hypothetical protein